MAPPIGPPMRLPTIDPMLCKGCLSKSLSASATLTNGMPLLPRALLMALSTTPPESVLIPETMPAESPCSKDWNKLSTLAAVPKLPRSPSARSLKVLKLVARLIKLVMRPMSPSWSQCCKPSRPLTKDKPAFTSASAWGL